MHGTVRLGASRQAVRYACRFPAGPRSGGHTVRDGGGDMSETSEGARRKLTLAACCATHSVQDGLTASIYILLPILAQVFGLSFAQVGLVRAAHSGAMGLLELPSGVLSERFGQRRLLAFGLLCAGTGYITVSTAGGFTGLLVGLCIAGSGAAFQHALSSSLVSGTFSGPDRRTALGAYNSSGDTGKLLFTGLLTTGLGAGAAWPHVAAGYGSLAIAAGIAPVLPAPRDPGRWSECRLAPSVLPAPRGLGHPPPEGIRDALRNRAA